MLALHCTCVVLIASVAAVHGALTQEQLAIFRSADGLTINETNSHMYLFESHGLPDHDHGPFPNEDNPNTATKQDHSYPIPKIPTIADTPGCLPMGSIGMAINAVPFYNPYTAEGYNAVEGEYREIFDNCDGHPQRHGAYHYNKLPSCLYNGGENELLGIAFDGYLIYGPPDENGKNLTSTDLDFCHGRVVGGVYRYHITHDFPYILGCYKGEAQVRRGPPPPGGDGGPPRPGDGRETPTPGRRQTPKPKGRQASTSGRRRNTTSRWTTASS